MTAEPFPDNCQLPDGRLPKEAYTRWRTRVLASLIDAVPELVIVGVAGAITFASAGPCVIQQTDTSYATVCSGPSPSAILADAVAGLLIFAYVIWNFGHRQGATGSSIGKSFMKFKVISEGTGQPIGFGLSVLRQIAHFVDSIGYVGFLLPLWDAKRQTFADKIMATVCLPL